MLNVRELKSRMVRAGYNNSTMADALGISTRTFCTRLKTGDFGAKEIEIMIEKVAIGRSNRYFFCSPVTYKQQICRLQKDTSYFVGISDRKIYVKAVGVIGQRRFLIH